MKVYFQLQILSVLLLFISIVACKGPKDTDPTRETLKKTEQTKADFDPYFIESSTIKSAYAPSSITRNIMQDRKGNIWLATWEGIIKYDGKTFTNFTNKEDLRRFHVFSLLEDKSGNLWFGTIGAGVYLYDGKNFVNFTTEEGLANNRMGCFLEDKEGKIWIGSESGISIYDPNEESEEISFTNFTTKEGMTSNDVNSIVEDRSGKIWIGTRGEACTYDGKKFTKITREGGQSFTNVRTVIEDSKGNIWLGGNDGLWCYDGSVYTNIAKNFTGYIYEDRKGNIWTSSESSDNRHQWMLSRYDENALKDENPLSKIIWKKEDMFFGILEDKKGYIWLGTLNGVVRYDGNSFDYFTKEG